MFSAKPKAAAGVDREMRSLIQRLALSSNDPLIRLVTFIASRPGEGTSTVARDYATALASETAQKVLLIEAGMPPRNAPRLVAAAQPLPGLVDAFVTGQSPDTAITPAGRDVFTARWLTQNENRGAATKLARNDEFWQAMLESYDAVIIDAPSLQSSFDGIVLAARADATVMVVEAESTRQPVIENLRDTLAASGATIAGMVMNKRRFYIPRRIYRRL